MSTIRVIDAQPGNVGNVISDIIVNGYSSLSIPAYWRAMNFIAENMARFPKYVRDPKADGKAHPLNRLLSVRPSRVSNSFNFWRALFFHAAHTGNGYARIVRPFGGASPTALQNLPPEDVTPFRFTDETGTTLQFYAIARPNRVIVSGDDMIHIAGLSHDGMAGIDPVSLHTDTFQRASTIGRYQTKYLQKGTVIRGSIEIPNSVPDEKLDQIKSYLRQHFYGMDADEDVLILTDGGKLANATLTPQESQIVQQAQFSTKEIAQVTGVPPEFLFEQSEAKYNASVEQAGQNIVRYTLGPIIEQTEDELSVKLLSVAELDAGLRVRLNPDALIRGDTTAQTNTVVQSVNGGIRTRNEGRALLDLPPDTDPESSKLKTLGDSTAGKPSTPPAGTTSSSTTPAIRFESFQPLIDAACQRVDRKTEKAFTNAAKKVGQERTIWSNVFAEEQRTMVAETLQPIADTIASLCGQTFAVERVADEFCVGVRKRAIDGQAVPLASLIASREWQTVATSSPAPSSPSATER